MPGARIAAVLLPLTLALAGCSSSGPADRPSPPGAAEPADSPALTAEPAGTVVPLDPDAEGMVVDPVTGLLAVAVRDPDRMVLTDRDGHRSSARCRCPGTPATCNSPRPAARCWCPPRTRTPWSRWPCPTGRPP